MMRWILYKFLLTALCVFSLEKLIRTQTAGFREEKIKRSLPQNPQWEVENIPTPPVLSQPFFFLGSGVQSYAYISQDQTTVLKFFKHHHFGLPTSVLPKLPGTKRVVEKRIKRMEAIATSAWLSFTQIQDLTGVWYLSLNPPKNPLPTVILYDKIGVKRTIDLNHTPFLLQKKAEPFYSYLQSHPTQVEGVIDSLVHMIQQHRRRGITNTDPLISRNVGIVDGQVITLDIGSFCQGKVNPHPKKEKEKQRLVAWLENNRPELQNQIEAVCAL